MGQRTIGLAGAFALTVAPAVTLGAQELIDRLLAVVDGQIITLSDARGALALGLLPSPPAGTDAIAIAMNRLIDRELMLREVQRYLPPEPAQADIERRLAAIHTRFPDREAFEAGVAHAGFDGGRLADWIRNDLRIDAYLRERFAFAGHLSDSEVDAYLQRHRIELMRDRTVAQALDEARRRLAAERQEAVVAEWLAGLRSRAEIIELYLAPQG
jgi:hypothetical protein